MMSNLLHRIVLWGLMLGVFLLALLNLPASAAPLAQFTPFPTPTPGPDGRIIYIVQPGDTLWRISAITGVSLDELRALNNLGAEEPIIPGQELLIGLGGPAEATLVPGAAPTSTPLLPTPSPGLGSGTLCVILYNDVNGDALRQEEEVSIPGGAISVSDRSGKVSLTYNTEPGTDPHCFAELPEDEYTITVAIPEGYNPTTVLNYTLRLEPGSETYLDFGAQANSKRIAESPPPTGSGRSPLLGILGVLALLGGIGLGIVAALMSRRTSPPPTP
jgi:murein DD-endopeptidase MepM/ murein hydrolase activator NlpD